MKRPSGFLGAAIAALLVLAACETGTGADPCAPAFEQSALSSLSVVGPSSAPAAVNPGRQDPASGPDVTTTDTTSPDTTATGDPARVSTCLDFSSGAFLLVPCLAFPLKKGAADKAHGDPEPWRPGTPIPQSR